MTRGFAVKDVPFGGPETPSKSAPKGNINRNKFEELLNGKRYTGNFNGKPWEIGINESNGDAASGPLRLLKAKIRFK